MLHTSTRHMYMAFRHVSTHIYATYKYPTHVYGLQTCFDTHICYIQVPDTCIWPSDMFRHTYMLHTSTRHMYMAFRHVSTHIYATYKYPTHVYGLQTCSDTHICYIQVPDTCIWPSDMFRHAYMLYTSTRHMYMAFRHVPTHIYAIYKYPTHVYGLQTCSDTHIYAIYKYPTHVYGLRTCSDTH